MLLHESRRETRTSPEGELVLLDDQDRSLWNRDLIERVFRWLNGTRVAPRSAPTHCRRPSRRCMRALPPRLRRTGRRIVELYDVLQRASPSPVVELNRAVAVAMRDGPWAGLTLVDGILARGDLGDYYLAHSARADLCRRLGRRAEAVRPMKEHSAWRGQKQRGGFS